jgi:hypothetical protein
MNVTSAHRRRLFAVAAALVSCAVALSRSVHAEEPTETHAEKPIRDIPEGYQIERTLPSHWIVPGAFTFAASYLMAFSAAAASDFRPPGSALVVPFLGPFVSLAGRPHAIEFCFRFFVCYYDGKEFGVQSALLVDGVAQVVGATMFVIGVSTPKFKLARREVALEFSPAPVAGGYGLGVRGTY